MRKLAPVCFATAILLGGMSDAAQAWGGHGGSSWHGGGHFNHGGGFHDHGNFHHFHHHFHDHVFFGAFLGDPYVASCDTPWQRVAPVPPAPGGG